MCENQIPLKGVWLKVVSGLLMAKQKTDIGFAKEPLEKSDTHLDIYS